MPYFYVVKNHDEEDFYITLPTPFNMTKPIYTDGVFLSDLTDQDLERVVTMSDAGVIQTNITSKIVFTLKNKESLSTILSIARDVMMKGITPINIIKSEELDEKLKELDEGLVSLSIRDSDAMAFGTFINFNRIDETPEHEDGELYVEMTVAADVFIHSKMMAKCKLSLEEMQKFKSELSVDFTSNGKCYLNMILE